MVCLFISCVWYQTIIKKLIKAPLKKEPIIFNRFFSLILKYPKNKSYLPLYITALPAAVEGRTV